MNEGIPQRPHSDLTEGGFRPNNFCRPKEPGLNIAEQEVAAEAEYKIALQKQTTACGGINIVFHPADCAEAKKAAEIALNKLKLLHLQSNSPTHH